MNDDLQSQLQAYCVRAFPSRQGVRVSGLASVSAGWESDVYSFDVEHGPPGARRREELILRIYPGDDAHAKSAREFRGMRHLHEAGYPVPRVLLLERENSPFGRPFVIMERVEGRVLWPILFNAPGRRQQELLAQFCELFVRLHRLDWRPFVDDVARYELGGPTIFVDQWLRRVRGAVERFPLSNSLRILEWLEARREQVPCLRPAPVHWPGPCCWLARTRAQSGATASWRNTNGWPGPGWSRWSGSRCARVASACSASRCLCWRARKSWGCVPAQWR
jgi:aminoglycoside phosphotransferase (APT) family kinase protein